jgi:hypothetical protein
MDFEGPIDNEGEANSPELADDDGDSDGTGEEFAPEGFDRWRRDSALGSIGSGIARGLQSVFAPPPNQPLIVASVPGDPPDPDRIQVILDPDDPSKSVAFLPPAHEAGSAGSDDASD